MPGKRFGAEQIIPKLREAETDLAKGQTVVRVCKKIVVTEQTYHRWRNQYGGMKSEEAKRLKTLEAVNSRLKKLVASLSLDNQMLKELTSGNW